MIHFNGDICRSVTHLRSCSVQIEAGLTEQEIATCEVRFGFRFPPDLRAFLQSALPIGQGFPNWRRVDDATLRERLDWPFIGIAFDIEHGGFWFDEWGERPSELTDALTIARHHVGAAPKLIPVYSHRYIPETPAIAGNSVFSVHGTDIIYYGRDLWDYFDQEFGPHCDDWHAGQRYEGWTVEEYQGVHRLLPFWSSLVS